MAKNMAKSGTKPQERQRSRSRPNIKNKFETTIKPADINPENTSLKTRRAVQAKIDVKRINVAINSPANTEWSRGQSWIDLILTKNLTNDFTLEVVDDITNSDHRLLQVTWSLEITHCPSNHKIKFNHSNWLDLKSKIFNIISRNIAITSNDPLKQIANIQKEVLDSAGKHLRHNNTKRKRNAIWWTQELRIKRSKTRALRRLYQKDQNEATRKISF
ncbi:hypothetical protein CDAR_197071 [Caerostris darwini]|uniref:Endonuclease/exonuclease/phosphatase domain-containing protein n=1 Tax=Caerostris darwini TaxID=1538125 RepID=A0AAV4UJJ7_9ARAC|nr:hypothetical protein CDAR_197071 [Caerostris darwini]